MLKPIGSLYIEGQPVKPGDMYRPGTRISFGDQVPGFELYWKPIGKHSFILATPAILGISWFDLRDLNFVRGNPFQMDGRMFMVRLPRLGIKPPENAAIPEGIKFWGQETFIGFENKKPAQRSPISSLTINSWSCVHPSIRQDDLGFVPVLDEGI